MRIRDWSSDGCSSELLHGVIIKSAVAMITYNRLLRRGEFGTDRDRQPGAQRHVARAKRHRRHILVVEGSVQNDSVAAAVVNHDRTLGEGLRHPEIGREPWRVEWCQNVESLDDRVTKTKN